MLISLEGVRKTGKTTFALSAPPEIVFFDFELGLHRVEPRFMPDEKGLKVLDYGSLATLDRKKQDTFVLTQWGKLLKDYSAALESETTTSIVFDTFTAVWELRRMAYMAELRSTPGGAGRKNLMPQEYATPNADMKMLLVQAQIHHKNLILTHHLREQYKEGKPTGVLEADGFKHTGDAVDVILHTSKAKCKPLITIRDCGLTMRAEGLEVTDPNYDKVFKLITQMRTA